MLGEEDEDVDIEIRFLREAHKIDNAYADPVVEDIHAVPVTSVKVVLPRPIDEQRPTKRTTVSCKPGTLPYKVGRDVTIS